MSSGPQGTFGRAGRGGPLERRLGLGLGFMLGLGFGLAPRFRGAAGMRPRVAWPGALLYDEPLLGCIGICPCGAWPG